MAGFDYDVLIIGSGFGGSVAALRSAEKGYRVGVMESGCNNGCGHNAKNKLTTNYLYLAEKLGVEVHDLHEVYELTPLDRGGFEVRTAIPAGRSARRISITAPGPPVRSSWPRTPTARRSSCTTCSTQAA